jgi:hypothetical protein
VFTGIGPALIVATRPFVVAGSIMNAFDIEEASMQDGGASGALVRFGLSEAAQRYERKLMEGSILNSVHADKEGMATVVRKTLEEAHGQEISEVLGAARLMLLALR